MDLLERYLAAVGRELPDAERADILAELRDVLMNHVEEKEAELGQPLDSKAMEALLVEFGHPLTVAGRYRKHQYLIGPEMFPFWWKALKVTTAWVVGVYVVLAIIAGVSSGDVASVMEKMDESPLFSVLMFTFAGVTIISALIERFGKRRYLTRWKPRDLPPPMGRKPTTVDLAFEVGASAIALLWWVGVIRFQDALPSWGMRLELAPIWTTLYVPILLYWVAEVVFGLLALARPAMAVTNGLIRAARYVYGAGLLAIILQAQDYVLIVSSRLPEAMVPVVQDNFNRGFRIGFIVTIVCMLGYAALTLWRVRGVLMSRRPLRPAAA